MISRSVDILVPVWNSPFETRACLAALLEHSPDARLIIIDNGSSRETQLMLEEFSESLGERGLFMTSDRNIGLVPAINRGLARSDSDFAVIVRPHVTVTAGWLTPLLEAAHSSGASIVSPRFSGSTAPDLPTLVRGCSLMESTSVSFCTLLLSAEMRTMTGPFDEGLDGGEWCLKEYVRRAAARGYHTCLSARPLLLCGTEQTFGSAARHREIARNSQNEYTARWGVKRHYAVYFGAETTAAALSDTVAALVAGARMGHSYHLLLHGRQYREFCRMGWNGLHTGIELMRLPLLFPLRALSRRMQQLSAEVPDLIAVWGGGGLSFPGYDTALPLAELLPEGSTDMTTTQLSKEEEP